MSNDLTTLARDIANTRDMLAVNHPGAGSIWAEYCATIGGHAYTDARDCGESWAEANEIAMATELEWLARFGECYLATEPDAAEYAAKHYDGDVSEVMGSDDFVVRSDSERDYIFYLV